MYGGKSSKGCVRCIKAGSDDSDLLTSSVLRFFNFSEVIGNPYNSETSIN